MWMCCFRLEAVILDHHFSRLQFTSRRRYPPRRMAFLRKSQNIAPTSIPTARLHANPLITPRKNTSELICIFTVTPGRAFGSRAAVISPERPLVPILNIVHCYRILSNNLNTTLLQCQTCQCFNFQIFSGSTLNS